jgi:hypothetical protein
MTQDQFDKLRKPESERRDWKTNPLTDQEVKTMMENIQKAHEEDEANNIQRWDEKAWLNLHRPMSI